jgi:predicted transporter
MFAMAGVFLLAALIGCLLVAGGILLYKRWKSRSGSDEPSHTSLRI